ncbi:class I SAM-dependent methyltransferase [Nitrospiraceae bacterium AH_259_D15_M11_P09]|nr:class I SAM-dependent methyltransferase [Nitrospiraceae bacterium AH_259_D15_M11_P09]
MMTPEEYTRYNSIKAFNEFGKEMNPDEFRAARKNKLHWIRNIIKDYKSVADYGAGSGWLKEMCDEMNIRCIEIDESFERGSFANMEPVDLVVSVTVLEHMTPDEVLQFVDISAQKARYLFVATNNPGCAFSHYVLWDDITHVRLYSEGSIRALLMAKGWAIERMFYEDSVFKSASLSQRLIYRILSKGLGMMFLSNIHNYWCILARSPKFSK